MRLRHAPCFWWVVACIRRTFSVLELDPHGAWVTPRPREQLIEAQVSSPLEDAVLRSCGWGCMPNARITLVCYWGTPAQVGHRCEQLFFVGQLDSSHAHLCFGAQVCVRCAGPASV